jgi:hypothetical protein
MVLMFKIYTGALKIIYIPVRYIYYMHLGSKNDLRTCSFTIIYAPMLSKNNGTNISPQIFEISLPFCAHGKTNIST